jgi:hypothetical protein
MANRVFTLWASHETRARIYGLALLAMGGLNALMGVNLYRSWTRDREVVRIGCDGIPQLVRVNDEIYSEPDEREIRAYAMEFAVFFMRSDSYSIVNDTAWCMRRMTPELAQSYKRTMVGTKAEPGLVAIIERLKRRTQIDTASLELKVDKKSYPWRVMVTGVRQIVGQEQSEPFSLGLELYRASRNEVIEGLVISGVRPHGVVNAPSVPDAASRGER